MDQIGILKKLAKFIALTVPGKNPELEKDMNSEGHCFGFAIAYAAMEVLGKTDWWEAAISALLNWNEDVNQLQTVMYLPNAENPAGETLGSIIFKILNYAIPPQLNDAVKKYVVKGTRQATLLAPNGIFEILDANYKKLKIHHREFVSGFLDDNDLMKILDENHISGNICLVHNVDHTITLSYVSPYWRLYDSNYQHGGVGKTAKCFTDKNALIKEIFARQSHSIALELAHFSPSTQIVSPFESFYANTFHDADKVANLFRGKGLHVLCSYNPDKLPALIFGCRSVKNIPQRIAYALSICKPRDWTGLKSIAIHMPAVLDAILDLLVHSNDCRRAFVRALQRVDDDGDNGLYFVTRYVSSALPKIFGHVCSGLTGIKDLLDLLQASCDRERSGLQYILKYAKSCIPDLLKCIQPLSYGPDYFLTLLSDKNKFGHTGLDTVLSYAPEYLSHIIDFIGMSADASELFLKMLLRKHSQNESAIDCIIAKSQHCIPKIIALFEKHHISIENHRKLIGKILEKTSDKHQVDLFFESLVKTICTMNLDLLAVIPKQSNHRSTHAFKLISHMLGLAKIASDVRHIIETIEKHSKYFQEFFSGRHSNKWHRLIHQAQLKMIKLILDNGTQLVSDEDKRFMARNTKSAGFFSASIQEQTQKLFVQNGSPTCVLSVK